MELKRDIDAAYKYVPSSLKEAIALDVATYLGRVITCLIWAWPIAFFWNNGFVPALSIAKPIGFLQGFCMAALLLLMAMCVMTVTSVDD